MIDPDELPIPQWGLRCPSCDVPLAGMHQHRCDGCGEPFNMLQVLDGHRPVPDLGLACEDCGYPLKGLPSTRCPECGSSFSVREMIEDMRRIDPDELPIPQWGVRCPSCDVPLAGMHRHRCDGCGEPFNILQVLDGHRPVPDLGLACEDCGYPLKGLPSTRCPECGSSFSVREMIEDMWRIGSGASIGSQLADPRDHHVKRREPVHTGNERPLPDFGLSCSECAQPLAGSKNDLCPECGHPFDMDAVTPNGDWIDLTGFIPRSVQALAKHILYGSGIPYLVDNAGLTGVYGGRIPLVSGKLRIPREFFFDALNAMAEAEEPDDREAPGAWTCPDCDEQNPSGFEICWNCSSPCPE